ncbi:hypothetical protein [Nonomuraea sediminis]|uniref:hypothetical protein n=1 Tax=Nonomuraea sediminis TaxID=2835864 RepID=UPI00202A46FB|nr:hypothetical protein [Nonomuraea sediminis]
MNRVYLELGPKKVFACSADWPGWCRIGKSEELALDTFMDYVPRYALIAARAGVGFAPGDPVVVERVPGSQMTDFGAPFAVPELDREPLSPQAAERQVALLRAAWELFDEVAATAPAELRKGPRGGGRDRDKVVDHVTEAERAYARKLGVRHKPYKSVADRDVMRAELVGAFLRPPGETGWPVPYALRRTAWHVIDHLWEIEDKSV